MLHMAAPHVSWSYCQTQNSMLSCLDRSTFANLANPPHIESAQFGGRTISLVAVWDGGEWKTWVRVEGVAQSHGEFEKYSITGHLPPRSCEPIGRTCSLTVNRGRLIA